jgi:hypothetical protein
MKTYAALLLTALLATPALGQYRDAYSLRDERFGICVKAGAAFPVSEFANLFKPGFAGAAEVSYHFSPRFQVYCGVGFSRFNVDNGGLSNELAKDINKSVTTDITAPYQVIPVVVGINISYQYPHFWPYFTLSGGVYFQKLESSGSYTADGALTTLEPTTQTWNQSAYSIGLGGYIPIGNDGWAVDVNVKFNSVVDYEGRVLITVPEGDDVSTRAIRYVSALAGLSYTFH